MNKQYQLYITSAAHKMTREIVDKYKDVKYRDQYKLCYSYLLEEYKNRKGGN